MSFSQELKDFVSAFQSGYEMIPHQTDEDYKRALTEHQRAATAKLNSHDPNLDRQKALADINATNARAEYYRNPALRARAYKGTSSPEALSPEQQEQLNRIMGSPVQNLEDPNVEGPNLAFSEGGIVPQPNGAIPTQPTPNAGANQTQLPTNFSFEEAQDAVRGAYDHFNEQFKLSGAVPAPNDRGRAAMENAIGAVDPSQLDEMDRATGLSELPEDRKNMARLARVWQFYQQQGLPNRAKAAASDLVQTYRMIHNRFNAIAQAAAQEGDVDGAIDAALRAYAYIPDGKSASIQKTEDGRYAYSYTDDATGKAVHRALLTPQEILQAVTNHGVSSFDELVMMSNNKEAIAGVKAERSDKREKAKARRAATVSARADNRKRMHDENAYSKEEPAHIGSEEEFDQLPIGAWFLNPADGKPMRKNKNRE